MPEGMILSNEVAAIFTRYVVPDTVYVINDAAGFLFRFA
jgi:hypothetical protein